MTKTALHAMALVSLTLSQFAWGLGPILEPSREAPPKYYFNENTADIRAGTDGAVSPEPPKGYVKITPEVLRERLLSANGSVLESINNVYIAKEQLASAHAALVPAINFQGALTNGLSGLTSLAYTVPFLMPTNWFNIDAKKNSLVASGYSYYISELNTFALAYSLYISVISDYESLKALQFYSKKTQFYIDKTQAQLDGLKVSVSSVPEAPATPAAPAPGTPATPPPAAPAATNAAAEQALMDLLGNLKSFKGTIDAQILANKQVLISDESAFRQMLGYPFQTKFAFLKYHCDPLAVEGQPATALLKTALIRSPEIKQLNALEAFTSATGLQQATFGIAQFQADPAIVGKFPNETPNYNGIWTDVFQVQGLGITIVPNLRVVGRNLDQLKLQERDVRLNLQQTVENNLTELVVANQQIETIIQTNDQARKNYNDAFAQAIPPVAQLLQNAQQITASEIAIIKQRAVIDHYRIAILRATIGDQFASIPKCNLAPSEDIPNPFEWVFGIFAPDHAAVSVDQICKEAHRRQPPIAGYAHDASVRSYQQN